MTPESFWERVDRSGGPQACWPWRGCRGRDGHGQVRFCGRNIGAHRLAWSLANGLDLDGGMVIRHLCDNPTCCNPAHLQIGTHADNVADRVARGRSAKGVRNGRAKLCPMRVERIRAWHRRGLATTNELAQLFGVSPKAIRRVVAGEVWKSV
jgi:hypothetical protein